MNEPPLSNALRRLLGRPVTEEELAEARRRLSRIAEVLSAVRARNEAATTPLPQIKTLNNSKAVL